MIVWENLSKLLILKFVVFWTWDPTICHLMETPMEPWQTKGTQSGTFSLSPNL